VATVPVHKMYRYLMGRRSPVEPKWRFRIDETAKPRLSRLVLAPRGGHPQIVPNRYEDASCYLFGSFCLP
jgi:hypothetical protein